MCVCGILGRSDGGGVAGRGAQRPILVPSGPPGAGGSGVVRAVFGSTTEVEDPSEFGGEALFGGADTPVEDETVEGEGRRWVSVRRAGCVG